jgi:hypothetical protein
MPSEDPDIEDYLAKIKRRWDSALLSDQQNQNIWDDTWMTGKKDNNEESPKQRIFRFTN